MTSRTAQKREASKPADKKPAPKLNLLRVRLQWTAVYEDGDEPREQVSSDAFDVAARDWPGIRAQVEADLARLTAMIVEAGGFESFRDQQEQLARQQQG